MQGQLLDPGYEVIITGWRLSWVTGPATVDWTARLVVSTARTTEQKLSLMSMYITTNQRLDKILSLRTWQCYYYYYYYWQFDLQRLVIGLSASLHLVVEWPVCGLISAPSLTVFKRLKPTCFTSHLMYNFLNNVTYPRSFLENRRLILPSDFNTSKTLSLVQLLKLPSSLISLLLSNLSTG